jgi:Cu2+-containing amine oxidase
MSAETNYRYQIADRARRGEKMILWSTYYGANYRYLIEYGFSDDGMLSCRLGPTGRNLNDRQDDLQDTHLHIGCWRLEFDLGDPTSHVGGPKDNEILLVRRLLDETTDRFGQLAKPFAKNAQGQACEGSARWNAEEFTTLRVQSRTRKNSHGRPIAYDLISQRIGGLRQLQPEGGAFAANMDFINYDYWVTRTEPGFTTYLDVPQYAAQRRPLEGFPTTVWHCTPALHFPRSEDFASEDGRSSYGGLAVTFWTGFFVKPRDLFDSTPFYQPRSRPPRVMLSDS